MTARHTLITAGPTREPIDAVRYISNRSSGQVGIELAHAAVEMGHQVTLLLGPVDSAVVQPNEAEGETVGSITVHRFETVADLEQLLGKCFPACNLLIMAAAVADYRMASPHVGKLPRQASESENLTMTLHLEPTPDLVAGIARSKRPDQRIIAFALEEPAKLETRAAEKLRRKDVDAIVANPLQTMDAAGIEAVFITATGERIAFGPMEKKVFARKLLEEAEARLG